MARIPDEAVERLKAEVSLLRLVEAKGIELHKHGKDWLGCCPFHADKTPSLVVSPDKNLWHCLGAFGVGGSVIDWVMRTEGVSFRHAVELLRHDAGLVGGKVVKQCTVPKLASPVTAAEDQAALLQVVEYYHATLKQSPDALAYLTARGLNHPALIDTFKLGYSNRTLGLRLPVKNRKAGATVRTQLQQMGILRESGHEHFSGSLVVPVFDAHGAVAELYGRKLLDNLRVGTPKHTYLPGEHAGVWNMSGEHTPAHAFRELILCEALLDAMTFWVHGFRHVTSSYGVNGFTDDHLAAFKQHKVERVLIAYDRDDAGNAAAQKLAEKLTAHGIACYRVLFPKGMDANSYALKMQPPAKALELVIKQAQLMEGSFVLAAKEKNMPARIPSRIEPEPIPEIAAEPLSLAAVPVVHEAEVLLPELPPLPVMASPVAALPTAPVIVAASLDDDLHFSFGDRAYRVRGLEKNTARDELRVQLMTQREDHMHLDKLDLYSSKQRQVFINQACVELGCKDDVIKKDLGLLLLALETALDEQRKEKLADKNVLAVTVEGAARTAALALLQAPDLLERILRDFDEAGVVGEEANKLVGYLACVSRKLDKPLAVMIQSSSAAGKSSLMDAVLALMPEEERVQYSAMTGQSLFYMGETNLKNKILAIAEEEGAHNASYALKLLQSEGVVTIASTGKDETTGNLVTREYKVQGPVMLFLTTTAIDIDEELLNRCLVLSVNESREQTQAIHRAQRSRRTLAGLQAKLAREAIIALHGNAQRLLRPLHIINPYADQLTFLDDKTRTRRDHEKYLTLIDSIALLHQHQRDIKTVVHDVHGCTSAASAGSAGAAKGKSIEYIEVTLQDIAHANRLAHEVLGRTLDELPPQTRKMLKAMQLWVSGCCEQQGVAQNHFRFSRKHVREQIGWTNDQVRVHLDRLVQLEYVLVHRGGRGQCFDYELLYDGQQEAGEHMMGLLDVNVLKNTHTTASVGGKGDDCGVSLGGHWGGNGECVKTLQGNADKALHATAVKNAKGASGGVANITLHHSDTFSLVAAL